jgi:two-component system LytT family sensor kinase
MPSIIAVQNLQSAELTGREEEISGRRMSGASGARLTWGLAGLVLIIVALSSMAPFVRFGSGAPRLDTGDLWLAALYLVAWAPFVGILFGFAQWTPRVPGAGALVVTGHVLLLVSLVPLHSLLFLLAQALLNGSPLQLAGIVHGLPFQLLTLLGAMQYLVLLAVLAAILAGRAADRIQLRSAELEVQRARLESQLTRARIDALRAQLQPHFLFNTLNSISVLTGNDAPSARQMIRRLSELLRAVLADGDRPTLPLRRELELLDAYVEIQRVRFGERLRLHVENAPGLEEWAVPALILQPLVENAIRYAVSDREAGGRVDVSTRQRGDRLVLEVRDDGPGCAAPEGRARSAATAVSAEWAGRGVGHTNTRQRLEQLYGDESEFIIESAPHGGCVVRLTLPAFPQRLHQRDRR